MKTPNRFFLLLILIGLLGCWFHAGNRSHAQDQPFKTHTIPNGPDAQRQLQSAIANQCLTCHRQNDRYEPLGPVAGNLNRKFTSMSEATQLVRWIDTGILENAPAANDHPKYARFDDPESGDIGSRARVWLDVNCAHCHNPVGTARTSGLDLRIEQLEPAKWGVMKSPVAAGKGSGGRKYDIVPGKPDDSILLYRIESQDVGARMPNLARNRVFDPANDLVRRWIESLHAGE